MAIEDINTEASEIDVVEEQISQNEPPKETSVLDSLPEKYRGKKIEDVVKMHQEAEKLASRHAQEVGEVRKLADELIKSQLTKKPQEEPKEVDFFENPQEAMRQAIANSPEVRKAEEYGLNAQRQLALQTLAQKHPDYAQVNQDQEFQDWIAKSNIRKNLYQSAQDFDFDAGDELLSTFKELRAGKQKQMTQVEEKTRNNALSAAAVETSGTTETSRKTYKRSDILNLQIYNPRKFDAMRDEIDAAYREGRVK